MGVDHPERIIHLVERPHVLRQVHPGHPDDRRADDADHDGPRPLTKPAAGVMPTSPQIMPFRPPRNVGFFSGLRNMSMRIQTIMAVAVATLVLMTAAAESAPAKYGSPPLKPFQPSHRIPAPTATNIRLFGMARSRSRASRGPMTAAATNPDVPAARWMT